LDIIEWALLDSILASEDPFCSLTKRTKQNSKPLQYNTNLMSSVQPPAAFLCPIGNCIMKRPVTTPQGITFEYREIMNYLKEHRRCPKTGFVLNPETFVENRSLQLKIRAWEKARSNEAQIGQARGLTSQNRSICPLTNQFLVGSGTTKQVYSFNRSAPLPFRARMLEPKTRSCLDIIDEAIRVVEA